MTITSGPPAFAALADFPQLQLQCGPALAAQARRAAERNATAVPRPAAFAALAAELRGGRLIALECPRGHGATTLLCTLAAARRYALWLPEDDAGAGMEALCAQVLALARLTPSLLPPAAGRDALTLERLLTEAGAARAPDDPLVVLVGRRPDEQATPLPPPFPAQVPPGVAIVLACAPGEALPLPADARVGLAAPPPELIAAARGFGAAPELAAAIAERAGGSFLYVRLAAGLCASGTLLAADLPAGLAALHAWCWERANLAERRLAARLAAAGEPIEPALLASAAGVGAAALGAWARRWRVLLAIEGGRVRLYHPATLAFVQKQSGDALAMSHAAYVRLARERAGGALARLSAGENRYLLNQLARHVALGPPEAQATAPELATRSWAVARERVSGGLAEAAQDMAWLLRASAVAAEPLALVRHAMLAGLLAHLGRRLAPDAPAEAFEAAVAQGSPREATLRRVREMLGQVADGPSKAQALRRLGEVCYALRMRASAMRMLSEALDLETPGPSRQWRDEREETLVAFARAAVAIDMPQTALGITARISHAERRGMIETEVVRWLLERGQRTRAEEVAYAIGHTAMHEWAMAEVAVGHARAGDFARGETVLGTLRTETAIAWARTELACDAARHGVAHALGQLAPIQNNGLLDRALALVAVALALGGHPEAALDAARDIGDRAIRTRALIDLAGAHLPNATAALAQAAAALAELTGDERAPLVAELAAAHATFGRLEVALRTAELLDEDEERDRAQSRVAVALARAGAAGDARIVAEAIGDDDERDWAFDELARLAATREAWDEALQLAGEIVAGEQRAHTLADLAISQARAGAAAQAHALAARIEPAAERLRALTTIAAPLIAQGRLDVAYHQAKQLNDPDQRARYQAALVVALAEHGDVAAAAALAEAIARPAERMRALAGLAAAASPALARQALGAALRIAAPQGRSETFRCLGWCTGTLARLGGADLLLAAASAIDEIDSWWV